MGRNVQTILLFCIHYPGWHSISKHDRPAQQAVSNLVNKGLLERNEYGQVRIALPSWAYGALNASVETE